MRCSSPKIFHINVSHLVIPTHWINRLHTHTHYTHCLVLVETSQMFRCKNSYLVRLRFSGYKSSWLCVFLCDRWNSRLLISSYVDWHWSMRAFEHRSKVLVTINSVEMCVFVVMYLWRRHTHTQKQNMASFAIPKTNNPVQMNHHEQKRERDVHLCTVQCSVRVANKQFNNKTFGRCSAFPLGMSELYQCKWDK